MPPEQSANPLRRVLANSDFVRLWMAGMCMGTMRWLEVLAVGVYTLNATNSALAVALMYFARTAPTLVFAPWVSTVAGRVSRRNLLCTGLVISSGSSIALASLAMNDLLAMWHVAVGAVISGAFWSMEHAIRRTMARDVVETASVGNAISLDAGTQNATRMLGPLAGGALFATIGMPGTYAVGAVVYAAALISVLVVKTRFAPTDTVHQSLRNSMAGVLRYVANNQAVASVLAITLCLNLFGSPYLSLAPVLGREVLGLDASGIGAMMSAEGGGAMLAASLLAFIVRPRDYMRLFTFGAIGFVAGIGAFSLSTTFTGAMVSLFVTGLGLGSFAAMQSTILLTYSEPAMRARVMGLLAITIGAGPIGTLLIGGATELVAPADAIAISSLLGLIGFAALIYRWPRLIMPTTT
jgi:MFS family permease